MRAVGRTADELRRNGFEDLGRFVALKPPHGQPILVVAVQYFFRKNVQADPEMAAELQFHEIEKLSGWQEAGFQGLHLALAGQGERLEGLLSDALDVLGETRDLARETRDVGVAVRDDIQVLRSEMAQQGEQFQKMYLAVLELLGRNGPAPAGPGVPPVATPDPCEGTIAEMRATVDRCGGLPTEEKRQHKALFRAVDKVKATLRAHDARRKLRRNVLPAALFGGPPVAAAGPVALPPAAAPPVLASNSVFGLLPKSKPLRSRPGNATS